MNLDTIEVILGAIVLVVPVFAQKYMTARFTPQKMASVLTLADIIVRGVEQFGNDRDDVRGVDKLALAISALQEGSQRNGVKLSDDEATAYIHAALADLHTYNPIAPAQHNAPGGVTENQLQEYLEMAAREDAANEAFDAEVRQLSLIPEEGEKV